jgi:hypothetical protein
MPDLTQSRREKVEEAKKHTNYFPQLLTVGFNSKRSVEIVPWSPLLIVFGPINHIAPIGVSAFDVVGQTGEITAR